MAMIRNDERERTSEAMTQAAKGAMEALVELTREHIELARIELSAELRAKSLRYAWFAAGGATAALAGLVLLAAIFALLGSLIDSVGVRLMIVVAILAVSAFALILRGSSLGRSKPRA